MTAADFRTWRTARGLTQPALAALLDMSIRQIANYEAGKAVIPRTVEYALYWLDEMAGDEDFGADAANRHG